MMPFDLDMSIGKVTVRNTDHFPREIFDIAEQVKILDMSTISLDSLPDDLNRLLNLQIAFFSNNERLEEFPSVFASCKKLETIGLRSCNISTFAEHSLPVSLRALILTDNHITALPASIGECVNLEKIMMSGNRLQSLPHELLSCQKLEIVRFAVNDLASSPDWLFELPNLAWYADSSNPFSMPLNQERVSEIAWSDVAIGKEIGKSNNNVVCQARLKTGQDVAVKIFGHALVTDGLPADDMNACLRLGTHPNVIGGIGKIVDAPDGQEVLVMPLIPAGFTSLGNPPNLSTVCRDTYLDNQTFTASYICQVLKDVAAGMRYMHSKGVMHGDLYAHNILTNAAGNSYVGDFGGASLYVPGSAEGLLREHIDVRAFGILTNELVSRCESRAKESVVARLEQLTLACLNEVTEQRPTFAEIDDILSQL